MDVRVVVLGSLVFDIAIQVDRVPAVHETILATGLTISGGGKGLCQAIAARRLGAHVELIGRLGDDVFGEFLFELIDAEDIGRSAVVVDSAGTHIGLPIITSDGNNRIIGVPRSSGNVGVEDVNAATAALANCNLLLLQGETPIAACWRALELVDKHAVVVWNPAPATFQLEEMLGGSLGRKVNWLTPNEFEAAALTNLDVVDANSATAAARFIQKIYPHVGVVVTLGDRGSIAVTGDGIVLATPPFSVSAIDSTAAGDTFSAAFGVAFAASAEVDAALTYAAAAAALTTTQLGAVSSIPVAQQVTALIQNQNR